MRENPQDGSRPTVVLAHGAFAESASWNGVIGRLQDQGYTVIAAANPLRSLSGDAEFVASIFEAVEGPSSWSVTPTVAASSAMRPETTRTSRRSCT